MPKFRTPHDLKNKISITKKKQNSKIERNFHNFRIAKKSNSGCRIVYKLSFSTAHLFTFLKSLEHRARISLNVTQNVRKN